MYLNRNISRSIIGELSPHISFDINIINSDGVIVASTNKAREEIVHEGGRKLLREHLDELIIESDDLYEGCKKGVNFPINFDKQVIGVVGISGEPQKVVGYGRIVQKMTEMLIYEYYEGLKKSTKEQKNLLLATDLVLGNFQESRGFEEQIIRAGLKPEGMFTVAIIITRHNKDKADDTNMSFIIDGTAKNYLIDFLSKNNILCVHNGDYFLAITNHNPRKIVTLIETSRKNMREKYGIELICTIGNQYREYGNVPKSYKECLLLRTHMPYDQTGIYQFDETVLELTLDQLPTVHKEHLVFKVFQHCSDDEIQDFCSFTELYFESNGSLHMMAEKTFVHKNTIQYKIKKILKKTGLDMRTYHDLFVLYLAAKYAGSRG